MDPDVKLLNPGNPVNAGHPGNSPPASPNAGGMALIHRTQIPPSGSAFTASMLFNAISDHALLSTLSCPAACCRTSWPGRELAMPRLADQPSAIQLSLRLHSQPSSTQVAISVTKHCKNVY
jgi:hypothetical protein